MKNPFRVPNLTRRRIGLAYATAIAADGIQLLLGPLGWAFIDEFIDGVAMILLSLLVGFHPLFLPTFIVELVPVVDMLPTWTGCLALVTSLRRRKPEVAPNRPPRAASERSSEVIDV